MNLDMNMYRSDRGRGSYYADNYQQTLDNLTLVAQTVEMLYFNQNEHDYYYQQRIDTIRPKERSPRSSSPVRQQTAEFNNSQQPEVAPPLDTSRKLVNEVPPPLDAPRKLVHTEVPPPVAGADDRAGSFSLTNFAKGLAEASVDLGKYFWNVLNQNIRVLSKSGHLRPLVFLLLFLSLAAFYVNHESDTTSALIRKPFIHPPNATHMLLPDGRHLAYQEQGIRAENARFTIVAPNTFLSSHGKLDLKISLMQECGVRLITYDLPGFGKSDPHPNKNLKSAADDMLQLSYAMNVTEKFWVVGYSRGTLHAWAALKYIPDRLAGAFMVSPMTNPYEPGTAEEETRRTYNKWTAKRKFLYFLARKFPRFLPYVYRGSFLSANVGQRVKWLSLSLGKRDRAFIEEEMFQKFWQRDVEESVYQIIANSFVEETVLQA